MCILTPKSKLRHQMSSDLIILFLKKNYLPYLGFLVCVCVCIATALHFTLLWAELFFRVQTHLVSLVRCFISRDCVGKTKELPS